jgi:hypothetical protein
VFDAINAVSLCRLNLALELNNQDPERAFLLRVSYIEIYNETLRDLLNFKKGPLKDEEKPNIHFNKVSLDRPTHEQCLPIRVKLCRPACRGDRVHTSGCRRPTREGKYATKDWADRLGKLFDSIHEQS